MIDDNEIEETEIFTVPWMAVEPNVEPANFTLIIEDNDMSNVMHHET